MRNECCVCCVCGMRDIIETVPFFILRSLKLTVFCCLFDSLSYPSIPSLELSQECFKILIFTLSHIHFVYNPSPCSNPSLNNLQNYILEEGRNFLTQLNSTKNTFLPTHYYYISSYKMLDASQTLKISQIKRPYFQNVIPGME